MGWKASIVIIHNPARAANEQLLQEIGFNKLTKIKDEPFETARDPGNKKVYIGTYENNIILCTPDIPMQFFEETETYLESKFKKLFPNSEICAIVLHSTVNLWGYSIIINGTKVRARAGSSDDGTFVEVGLPLEEENELLSKSNLDSSGKRIYVLDDFPDEIFSEDQVGENFVFSICTRYFGVELNSADKTLFDTILIGYKYGSIFLEPQQYNSKPWWKLW
jgi:hypothetical protein